jgi:hydrogenase maturation protein HypF
LFDASWQPLINIDPIADTVRCIQAGQVVAIKGLGGFNLVCDAQNIAPIANLRDGKRREEKPFAVMVLNVASARCYAELSENEAIMLRSAERPIVLLRKTGDCDETLPGVAQGLSHIGLMLPNTPLHYLLFHELLGRPTGKDWLEETTHLSLVMTSANLGGEPLVKSDVEAQGYLTGLAYSFLTHDRGILHRCDDSVMRWQGDAPSFVRRARGFVPRSIKLPYAGPSVLACGAWLKNTVCVTRDNEAFVSQYIGDLDHAGTRRMLEETVTHMCDILDVQPQLVAHDLHPDFFSTQFAQAYATQYDLPLFSVQHHHAHISAVCAEHGVTESMLGLALDGVGLGSDGEAWGGELLLVEGGEFRRLGHLTPLAMPGGDHAARAPWRMAAAALFSLGRGGDIAQRFPTQAGASTIATMLQRELNCTASSSAGRLFDAAAGLLGVLETQSYEGQAAMLLEGLAARYGKTLPEVNGYEFGENSMLNFSPLLAALVDCNNAAYGAALFHHTLVDGLTAWVTRAAREHNVSAIALGGGCFHNSILTQGLTDNLTTQGLRVLTARQVPPNDGGISLGQAWVAIQRMKGS